MKIMTTIKRISCLLMPALLAQADGVFAQDLLENKPSVMWLSDDISFGVFDNSIEYESFVGKSEVWSDQWGVSAELLQNEQNDVFGMPADSEYFNFDVKRRFGRPDKTSVELGLGWQQLNIDSQLEASGPKLSLTGRFSLRNSLKLYGLTSWFPELEDEYNTDEQMTAYELEAGLLYQPYPFISLKAGYRHFALDLQNQNVEELGSSSNFLLGTDLSW